jgi:hypothetical protein
MSNLFIVAPQCWHEYLRLPPFAVFSMRLPHSGHAFWSCLMGFDELRVVSGNAITHCAAKYSSMIDSRRDSVERPHMGRLLQIG